MPLERDCQCCQDYRKIRDVMEGHSCITDHPSFSPNCLNGYVLLASMYEYTDRDGPFDDDTPQNR